jgi:outer membrane lipopolysaccharide assembly protein LptE/RlpB
MRSNLRFLLIMATISLIAALGWSVRGQQQTPLLKVTWEHAIISSSTGDNSARLSQLGADGWELVAVRSEEKFMGNFRQMEITYYLKRAKPAVK